MLNTINIEKFTNFGSAIFGITPEYIKPVAAEFSICRDREKFFLKNRMQII